MTSISDSDNESAQSGGLAKITAQSIGAAGEAGEAGLLILVIGVLVGGAAAIAHFAFWRRQA